MKKVIVTNYEFNKQEFASYRRKGVLVIRSIPEMNAIADRLLEEGFEQIKLRVILKKKREDLRKTVIDFCGDLNFKHFDIQQYNWWAINLSRREQTHLFPNGLAKLYLLRNIIDSNDYDLIVILDDTICPWTFLQEDNIKMNLRFKVLTDWKIKVNKRLPLSFALWMLRKIVVRAKLGWTNFQPGEYKFEKTTAIFTLIDQQCFHSGTFRDIYLGDLSKHIQSKGKQFFILGQLIGKPSADLLRNINRFKDFPLYLTDSIWSLKEFIIVVAKVFRDYFKRTPEWKCNTFLGFGIKKFIDVSLKCDLQYAYADALLIYHVAEKCMQQINVDTLFYPFENKCIERMLLTSLRKVYPHAWAVGFQHAVLTPKHIHFYLTPSEAKVLPLPNRISTTGDLTARILREKGNYPAGMIVSGTALRYQSFNEKEKKQKPQLSKAINILVVLAEGSDEYHKALLFLKDLQTSNEVGHCIFRVRLHPGIPYDPFKDKKMLQGIKCKKDENISLTESLLWSDILMYASSSVVIQAMPLGICAVWMDLLDLWGNDPVFSDDVLRWQLNDPADWECLLDRIRDMPVEEFNGRLENSVKFAEEYFSQKPLDIKELLIKDF